MWWILLLIGGCVTDPETKPGAPEAPKHAKAKTKAKAGKKAPAGQKRLPPTARKTPKKVGFDGPVAGQLAFESMEDKTKATLVMTWEGGEATATLGLTPGTCVAGEVQELPDGTQPMWWASCESGVKKAEFAVGQKENTLWVQRALETEAGLGDWKQVREIPLVEGTVLSAE